MRFIATFTAVLLAGAVDCLPAQDTPTPTKLTFEDLTARPELRPTTCRLKKTRVWSGTTVTPDEDITIARFDEKKLSIILPDGSKGSCAPELCDVMERANATYAAWSPEQRNVNQELIEQRLDLWPAKVAVRIPMRFKVGELEAGYEATTVRLQDGNLVCSIAKFENDVQLPLYSTDFYARFRATLGDPDRQKRHWILAELQDKLVQLPTGRAKRIKKVKINASKPREYTLIYMSADWCGYCHEFNPELLAFYKKNKRLIGKRFDIYWVSRDRSEADMLSYARASKFPWPAVAWDQLKKIPRTLGLQTRGIPHLVLLDNHGGVIAASWAGKYEHPRQVLTKLDTLLKAKKKRQPKKKRK